MSSCVLVQFQVISACKKSVSPVSHSIKSLLGVPIALLKFPTSFLGPSPLAAFCLVLGIFPLCPYCPSELFNASFSFLTSLVLGLSSLHFHFLYPFLSCHSTIPALFSAGFGICYCQKSVRSCFSGLPGGTCLQRAVRQTQASTGASVVGGVEEKWVSV